MSRRYNPLLQNSPIDAAEATVPTGDADLGAYFARPTGLDPVPGIVVVHENRGLTPYIRDVVEGLASNGYMALAPDLLSREGGTDSIADVPPVLSEIPRERHTEDALASLRFLQEQGATKLGIIGFCFGGAVTWRTSVASIDLAVAVPFYGTNPPLEDVPNMRCAIFAVYGALDDRVNAGMEDILRALDSAGVDHSHQVYDEAQHAFHNHTSERYNPGAANAAWSDALNRFATYLRV